MKAFFYLTKYKSVNDAVQFYLQIINEALTGKSNFKVSESLKGANSNDVIVTYFVKDYFVARLLHPRSTIINWFQGILPEESYLWQKNKLRYCIYSFMEWFCLSTSDYNFFVSKAMLGHYQRKYNYKGNKYFIMPCFNAQLKDNFGMKVDRPSFVYIGSLSKWQCLDKTLELYKEINKHIPTATLEVLTNKQEEARQLLKKYQIVNASVSYVPLEELSEYLVKFKYGFLIREDININNVATPNKLCTYMASGVIPVYSDVIESFKIHLEGVKHKISLAKHFDLEEAKNQIIEFERSEIIDYLELHSDYAQTFDIYYNKDQYISNIRLALKELKWA